MKKFQKIMIALAAIAIITSLAFYPFLPDKVPNKWKNGLVVEETSKSSALLFSLLFPIVSFAAVFFIFALQKSGPAKSWASGWFSVYPEPVKKFSLGVVGFIFNEKFDINDYGKFYDFITSKYTRIFGVMFMLLFAALNFIINLAYLYPSQVFSPQGILVLIISLFVLTVGSFFYMARNHRKIGFIAEE